MAQGWNFGEVILQMVNAQQERNARAVAQERSQDFQSAEARERYKEAKALEEGRQTHQTNLQKLEQSGRMDVVEKTGKQALEQIGSRAGYEKDNLLLSQEPVNAEQLEEKYKGTALSGKFRAAARKDGMITYRDRALILGMDQQERESARADGRFNAQMELIRQSSLRQNELFHEAYRQGQASFVPVPERTSAIAERGAGMGSFALGALQAGMPGGNSAEGMLRLSKGWNRMTNAEQTASQNDKDITNAIYHNAQTQATRESNPARVMSILDRYAGVPLDNPAAAATQLSMPYIQELSQYNPASPALTPAATVFGYGTSSLLDFNLKRQMELEKIAEQNQGRIEAAQARK